jgi:ketosteroid isomerase-like protein
MKLLLSVFLLCFLLSFPLTAQNWTAEEQEVLDQIKKGWSAWEEAIKAKDLNVYLDKFKPAEDFKGWWTSLGSIWTLEAWKRTFDKFAQDNFYWENVQPLSITVYDEVALAYYYVIYSIEDKSGKTTTMEDKRFEVFRKVDGTWRWTGVMASQKELSVIERGKE